MTTNAIQALDDRTVLRILSEATAEIRETLPDNQRTRIGTADDARESLRQLLMLADEVNPAIDLDRLERPETARALLETMLKDPHTRSVVDAQVADPPRDQQKSGEVAQAAAITLGGLIAWLQTTIDISVRRVDGQTQFSFRLRKNAAGADVIKEVAKQVTEILRGDSLAG